MTLDITEEELNMAYEDILTILGAFSVEVDVTKEEVLIMLRRANMEFQKETSMWQLMNQFGNVYGLPSGLLMQNQLATMNFSIVNQITDWFGSMSRVGGKIPWHKDYIVLEPGRQIYDLSKESSKPYAPGTRRIHRVMWVARPEIFTYGQYAGQANMNGDDVLYNNNWNFSATGLNYGNSPLSFLGYTFDTIMMMQSAESRNKVLFSEFFHNLSGDILEITPQPGGARTGIMPDSKLFYYYFDESEVALNARNPELYKSETVSGTLENVDGIPPGQTSLIANPLDFKLDYIQWSSLSPWAKTWIWEYTLARCKYIQGSKWRKIKKTMAGGEMEYEIEFDYSSLLSEAQEELTNLKQSLRDDLKELSLVKILQDKQQIVDSASKIASRTPRIWKMMAPINSIHDTI